MRVTNVWVDDERIYARVDSGEIASYAFSRWKRLADATDEQRRDFYLSYGGIHWPQIDEDLSFEGMFADAGVCERTSTENAVYWC